MADPKEETLTGLPFQLALHAGIACVQIVLAADTPTRRPPQTGSNTFSRTTSIIDFAPGTWTDGVDRHLSDYQGKGIVVFSFEPSYLDSPKDVKWK